MVRISIAALSDFATFDWVPAVCWHVQKSVQQELDGTLLLSGPGNKSEM